MKPLTSRRRQAILLATVEHRATARHLASLVVPLDAADPMRNYAVPRERCERSPGDIAALVEAFGAAPTPRVEATPGAFPRLLGGLVSAGVPGSQEFWGTAARAFISLRAGYAGTQDRRSQTERELSPPRHRSHFAAWHRDISQAADPRRRGRDIANPSSPWKCA